MAFETIGEFSSAMNIVLFITFLILSFSLLYRLSKDRSAKADLKSILQALEASLQGKPLPTKPNSASAELQAIWNKIKTIAAQGRELKKRVSSYGTVLTAGADITRNVDSIEAAAEGVLELIMKRAEPLVLACAIVLEDKESAAFRTIAVSGISKERSSTALSILTEQLISLGDLGSWGYQISSPGTLFDFSAFGVELQYSIPLALRNKTNGALWLGFPRHFSGLSNSEINFLEGLAKHAASTFYSAVSVKEKSDENYRERDFLLGISHDLKSPGNTALFSIRDLLSNENSFNPEQKKQLQAIEKSLESQLHIISDVLDLAKDDKGLLSVRKKPTSLPNIITRLSKQYNQDAARKGISLNWGEIPDLILAFDPQHLYRIVSNLLSNAIKYTEEGTVTLSIKVIDEQIDIIVEDSGIGVPKNEQDRLFQRFQRLDNVGSTKGVGLGLAVSHALARANDADLSYEPRVGLLGSVFRLSANIFNEEFTQKNEIDEEHILVIDDEPAVCRAYARYLDKANCRVSMAFNCSDAISEIEKSVPSIVISDLMIGAEHAEIILSKLQSLKNSPPVVIISGSADGELDVKRLYSGDIQFIQKPASKETILCALNFPVHKGPRVN